MSAAAAQEHFPLRINFIYFFQMKSTEMNTALSAEILEIIFRQVDRQKHFVFLVLRYFY